MNATGSSSQSTLYVGRIPQASFAALIGTTYALAMVTAMIRLILQLKAHRRLYLDDWFLILATICLTTSTVLAYVSRGALYWDQKLNYNESWVSELLSEHVDIGARILAFQPFYSTCTILLWISIFAIKFAYLAFLRRLVDRIKPLIWYWRIVVGIAIVSLPVCIVVVYVSCPKWGWDAANCVEPLYFRREVALSVFETCLDIWIDLMIIALPIRLLWSVRIKLRQKIILGIFLSLNVFMAITACVRVAGLSFRGRYDELWFLVWQHIEACVAVAMVSLTAFRSAFISSDLLQRQKNLAKRQWYSSPLQTFRRKKASEQNDSEAILGLPSIPGGTVTGMQTFIEGGKHPRTVDEAGIHTTTSWKTDWAER